MEWTKTFTMQGTASSLFNDFSGSKEGCERKIHYIFDRNRKVVDDVGYEELADAHNALANLIEYRREKGPFTIRILVVPENILDRFYQVATYYIRTEENGAQYLEFSRYSDVLIGRDMVSKYIKEKTEECKHRIVCRTKEIKTWMYAGGMKFWV